MIYIFKCIVWRGNLLAVEIQLVRFVQWEWVMPFGPGHFSGQNKKATLHSFSLSLSLLSHRGPEQADLFQHESASSTLVYNLLGKSAFPYWTGESEFNDCTQFLRKSFYLFSSVFQNIRTISSSDETKFPSVNPDRIRSATYSMKDSFHL